MCVYYKIYISYVYMYFSIHIYSSIIFCVSLRTEFDPGFYPLDSGYTSGRHAKLSAPRRVSVPVFVC